MCFLLGLCLFILGYEFGLGVVICCGSIMVGLAVLIGLWLAAGLVLCSGIFSILVFPFPLRGSCLWFAVCVFSVEARAFCWLCFWVFIRGFGL